MDTDLQANIAGLFSELVESSAPFTSRLRVKVQQGTGNVASRGFADSNTVTWTTASTTTYQADVALDSDPTFQYAGLREGESRGRALLSAETEGVSLDALVTQLTKASGTTTLTRHVVEVGSGSNWAAARITNLRPSVVGNTLHVDLAVANRLV